MSAQAFLQPERLDASETWYCGRCKAHVRAEKKLDLWSAPELLVGCCKQATQDPGFTDSHPLLG